MILMKYLLVLKNICCHEISHRYKIVDIWNRGFIQSKLQVGKYGSAEEVLEIALRLFGEYDRVEAE